MKKVQTTLSKFSMTLTDCFKLQMVRMMSSLFPVRVHLTTHQTRWSAYKDPLWLNFSNLNPPTLTTYPSYLDIATQNHLGDSWIYLVITLAKGPKRNGTFEPGGHPIHLHGHNFALLAQSSDPYPGSLD